MNDSVLAIVVCAGAVVAVVALVAWLFIRETRRIGRSIERVFDEVSTTLDTMKNDIPAAVAIRLTTDPVVIGFDARTADRIAAIVQTEMVPTYDALRAAGDTLGRLMLGGTPNALVAQYDALVAAGEALFARTSHAQDKRQRATWTAAVKRWNPRGEPVSPEAYRDGVASRSTLGDALGDING